MDEPILSNSGGRRQDDNGESVGPLAPNHVADLRASGLTAATTQENCLRSESDPHKLKTWLNWDNPPKGFGSALCFPYYAADGTFTGHVRLKFDEPRADKATGKKIKYEAPRGSGNRLYIPFSSRPFLADVNVPIIFAEGEKKALALAQTGIVAVGLSGVWSWCRKGEGDGKPKELIEDFAHITLTGRRVVLVFDSDAATNDRVLWAEWYFAETLKTAGAEPRVVRLPDGADENDPAAPRPKVGADDFLLAHGADALKALIDGAAAAVRPNAEPSYERTDLGNGRRFAAFAKDYVRYVADRQVWYVFDTKRWTRDAAGVLVESRAKGMLRRWAKSAGDRAAAAVQALAKAVSKEEKSAAEKELEDAQTELGFAMKTQDNRAVRRLMNMARSEYPLLVSNYGDTFDRDGWLLNCPNGTVDLRTGEIHPHRREDFITKVCPIPFNPAAEPPLYLRFMNAIFGSDIELVAYVRRFGGTCLTGDVSSQTLHIFHGGGSNGKSTLVELWLYILGEYAGRLADHVLVKDKTGSRHPTEKAVLAGLRFAVAAETSQSGRLDETLVKGLTGGDTISARKMREDFFDFAPSHKLVLCTNHRPEVVGCDHAIWRRLRLVPFGVQFWTDADRKADPTGEYPEHRKADPSLPESLKCEAPGILADLVRAATEFYRSGRDLTPPDVVTFATREYRTAEDVFGMFFAERVRSDSTARVKGSELFDAYRNWCEANGYDPVGNRSFGAETKKRYKPIKSSAIFYPIVLVSANCDTGVREEREDGSVIPYKHESRFSPSPETHTGNRSHPPEAPVNDPDNGPFTFENSDAGGVAL